MGQDPIYETGTRQGQPGRPGRQVLCLVGGGGYDNTVELSYVVEAYDPETRAWSVEGRLPEPTFWHCSVERLQLVHVADAGRGRGFKLNSGSNDLDAGHQRLPRNPEELH